MDRSSIGFQVEKVYVQGSGNQNEDALVTRSEIGLFAVIDGATALNSDPSLTGAVAAQAVKDALDAWDGSGWLVEAVKSANLELGTRTGGAQLEKALRPSCCIAAVRWSGERLEYVQAGDCMAFVEYPDGTIRQLTHDSVARFDSESVKYLTEQLRKQDTSVPGMSVLQQLATLTQIRTELRPLLVKHRRMMNVAGGYSVLDGSHEAERYLEFGIVNASLITRVLLLSDGLQVPSHRRTAEKSWQQTADYAFHNGLARLNQLVLELEHDDPGCRRYPRLKPHDDKSGLLVCRDE